MSEQYSCSSNEIDSGILDDFILKVSSSESDSDYLRLEISSDEDDTTNGYSNSSKGTGNQSPTVHALDNRPINPVFNIRMINRTDCSQLLDYKLQLSNNKVEAYLRKETFSTSMNTNDEENSSSSESELELNTFKKMNNHTNKELFSSDEESSMDSLKNSCTAFKEIHEQERRITRSESFKKKKLLQKETLEILKATRSQKIKILVPFVSAYVPSGMRSKKFLKEELRQMKLFTFL